MMLAGLAEAAMRDLEDRVRVDGVAHGLAHALVVEGLHRLHPRRRRVGRGHLVHLHVRDLLERLELDDVGAVEPVHLLGGERAHRGGGVVAEVDELELVEVRPAAPVAFLARLEHLLAADLVGRQREGARAVRAHLELAVLRRVEDEERVVEELLGHRELRATCRSAAR